MTTPRHPTAHGGPSVVTPERILTWLRENEYSYFVDNDGDIGGLWDNRMFHFLMMAEGTSFQIRGQWNRIAGLDRLSDILEFTNGWNADRIWPKAFVRVRDDGSIVICADLTIPASAGFSNPQLDLQLRCGLATAAAFFDSLDDAFPDPMRVAS